MKKDMRSQYEVVMSNKKTGLWQTVSINAINLKIAEQKAEKDFSADNYVFEVHEKK